MADAQNDGQSRRPHFDAEWSEDERRRDDYLRREHIGFGSSVCSDVANLHQSRQLDPIDSGKRTEGMGSSQSSRDSRFWSDAIWLTGADGKSRRSKPGLPLLAHGVSNRVGRLRAYGNAIVPQVAAEVIKAFMEATEAA